MRNFLCVCNPEREKRHLCKLKTLKPEGDSDNCYTVNAADNEVGKRQFPAEEDDPENVADEAAKACLMVRDFFAERPHGKSRKLKALDAERNANDSNAAQKSGEKPL